MVQETVHSISTAYLAPKPNPDDPKSITIVLEPMMAKIAIAQQSNRAG